VQRADLIATRSGRHCPAVVSSGVSWPADQDLHAICHRSRGDKHKPPAKSCGCGIYAAYDIEAAAPYTGVGNVFGLVWGWGKQAVPAINGYRAEYARIAAILPVAREVSLGPTHLRKVAKLYRVPLITPHSLKVEDYRPQLRQLPPGRFIDLTLSAQAADLDAELRKLTER